MIIFLRIINTLCKNQLVEATGAAAVGAEEAATLTAAVAVTLTATKNYKKKVF